MNHKNKSEIKVIKIKTKLISIIKKITIDIAIFVILAFIFAYYNGITLNKLGNKKLMELSNYFNIANPNLYIGTYQFDDRFFIGELEFLKYRFVGNKVFYDGSDKVSYNYGNIQLVNGLYGDSGDYLFNSTAESKQEFYEAEIYNKVGRKIMKFYLPNTNYVSYKNDLLMLNNISEDKVVELSLSFDKEYTINKVRRMFPNNINLNWLWVDTYDKKQLEEMGAQDKTINDKKTKEVKLKKISPKVIFNEDEVYGIKTINSSGEQIKNPEKIFIDTICNERLIEGPYESIYKEIFSKLSKDNKTINDSDIKIIGVVVSGDVGSLKQLMEKKFIKSSTFGTIINKY